MRLRFKGSISTDLYLMIAFLSVLVLIVPGCGGSKFANLKKGTQLSFQGTIDNVLTKDITYDKEVLSVTAIGFENGDSASVVGIKPGLSKGKRVKLLVEYWNNIGGTDIFKLIKVDTSDVASDGK